MSALARIEARDRAAGKTKTVPVEPTEQMLMRGVDQYEEMTLQETAADAVAIIYRAMLDQAPADARGDVLKDPDSPGARLLAELGRLSTELTESRRLQAELIGELDAQLATLQQAARALVDKLDLIIPHVDSMCVFMHNHSSPYRGPDMAEELAALKALLR